MTLTNLTEANQALSDSSKFSDLASDSIPAVLYRRNLGGADFFIQISSIVEKFTGRRSEEIIEDIQVFRTHIENDDLSLVNKAIDEAISSGQSYSIEYRLNHKDGLQFWVLDQAEPDRISKNGIYNGVIVDITKLKKREIQQELSHKMKNATLQAIEEGVVVVNSDDEIMFVNEMAQKIIGKPMHELEGKMFGNIIQTAERDVISQGVKTGSFYPRITTLFPRHKSPVVVRYHITPLTMGNDMTKGFVFNFREAAQPILDNEVGDTLSVIQNIIDSLKAAIFIITVDHHLITANKLLVDGMRISRQSIEGKHVSEVFPPHFVEKIKEYSANVVKEKHPQFGMIEIKLGGMNFQTYNAFMPIFDNLGNVIQISVTSMEINDSKRMEQELHETRQRLDFAMMAGNIGLWDYYVQSNRVITNSVFCRMLMFEPQLADGEFSWLVSRIHPLDIGRLYTSYYKHRKGVTDKMECEIRIKTGNDEYLWTQLIGRIVERGPNQEPTRIIGVQLDVSRRKELMQELSKSKELAEQANQTKSYFLANLSHEIRTPMNAIIGFSQMLASKINDPALLEYIHSIRNGGETLLSLINDILDLSKIEADKVEIKPEPIDLRYVLDEVKQMFQYRYVQKGIGFRMEIDANLPTYLLLDELRLKQILLNLVSNAIKFTEQGEVVLIIQYDSDQTECGELTIEVIDTGIGVVESNLTKIFEPFVQHEGHDAKKYGGTGLGLSITKKLTELMDGQISVESTPGVGSKFTVLLHHVKQEHPNLLTSDVKKDEEAVELPVIMGIGLAFAEAKIIQKVILPGRQQILNVNSLQEAFVLIRSHRVSVVFADASFFNPLGPEMLEWKKQSITEAIPLVIVVSKYGIYDLATLREQGVAFVLKKPLLPSVISEIIDQYNEHSGHTSLSSLSLSDLTQEEAIRLLALFPVDILSLVDQLLEIQPHSQVKQLALFLKNIEPVIGAKLIHELGLQMDNALMVFDVANIQRSIYNLVDYIKCLRNIAGYES